jgi:hypothetical protein
MLKTCVMILAKAQKRRSLRVTHRTLTAACAGPCLVLRLARSRRKSSPAQDTAKPCWVGRRSAERAPRQGGSLGEVDATFANPQTSEAAEIT